MRKRYGITLGVLLLALALCTYISGQIYKRNLPAVTAEPAISTELRYQWNLSGTVHYETPEVYTLPVTADIAQITVQPGVWVSRGDTLLQFHSDRLYLEWLQCKVNEQELEGKIRSSASYTKELLQCQYTVLQESIKQLEELMDKDGWLYATDSGIVLSVTNAKSTVANAEIVTIGPSSGKKQLIFQLTSEQSAYCTVGTPLQIALNSSESTVKMNVERLVYHAGQQNYQCTVTTEEPLNRMEGQPITAELSGVSQLYPNVIPTSAIVENNRGNASFYVLREKENIMGKSYYAVLQSAYIVEQNEIYTALASPVTEQVITSWDAPLSNGATVHYELR